jgi:hypothetical protein
MPLPGERHGVIAGIRGVCPYLPRAVQGKSDCPVSKTIRRFVPDRPESLSLERGGGYRRIAEQGGSGFRRQMEGQGAIRRHVFRSILGRRHQTRKTCTPQTACRCQAGRSSRRCGAQPSLEYPTSVRFGPCSSHSFPAGERRIQFIGRLRQRSRLTDRSKRMRMRVEEELRIETQDQWLALTICCVSSRRRGR